MFRRYLDERHSILYYPVKIIFGIFRASDPLLNIVSILSGYLLACVAGVSKKHEKGTKLRANAKNKEPGEGMTPSPFLLTLSPLLPMFCLSQALSFARPLQKERTELEVAEFVLSTALLCCGRRLKWKFRC